MSKELLELVDMGYDQVTWYRKRWFIVISILIFAPATLLISLTGDIYAKKNDGVYRYSKKMKMLVALASSILIAQAVFKAVITTMK